MQHVEYLAKEMKADRFATVAIYLVHHNGRAFLTDGQHRLHAIIKSGKTLLFVVVHIFVTREEDVANDYIRRDCGASRTLLDSYSALNLPEMCQLTKTQIGKLGAAVVVLMTGFTPACESVREPGLKSRDNRRIAILDWAQEARAFYAAIAGTAHPELFDRSAVLAVALATFRYCPDRAREFWGAAAADDGLGKDEPAKVLLNYLIKTATRDEKKYVYARAVANTWNWFQKGERHKYTKVTDEQINRPIKIAGTIYNGKQNIELPYE